MVVKLSGNEQEFRIHRPSARSVFLVGDFNGWNQTDLPMKRHTNGDWILRLALSDGVYQFRYLVDGQWYTDYVAFGIERCPFGVNSVWVVNNTEFSGFPA
ncbi:MAG: isoamylase early set domain-containing protein [Planctomycetota bacterium]|jgi:1,4-alpha-glucan branching enzyme